MSPESAARARRLYRILLRMYPVEHRERFGPEMEDTFLALLARDSMRRGAIGRWSCWWGAAADAVVDGVMRRAQAALGDRTGRGGGGAMATWTSDIRYAFRVLVRRPVFFATAATTIALGIGANTAVFTVVNGFLLKPLPYEDPDELVYIWDENPELGWSDTNVSPANAWDWRDRSRTLEDLALFYDDDFSLAGEGPPELVSGLRVTPNILRLLGRAPVLGRDFADAELGEGRDRVAILMDGFWQRHFGRDPSAIGMTLSLDGYTYTIVGIMPPDFLFLDELPDVLVPQDVHPAMAERGGHYAEAIGRLAEGVSPADARSELRAIAADLAAEYPEDNAGWTVEVTPAHEEMLGDLARQASYILMAAVGFILLMACVNVANLLLARGGARSRELAVRAALGAGRARIARQLLMESLVLGAVGGAFGLAIGSFGSRAIVAALPTTLPPVFQFEMDDRVLAFATTLTIGAVLLFGLLPAFRAARAAADAVGSGGRSTPGRRAGRIGGSLVVLQTSMAVVLLVGAGLLMKSIAGMKNQDFGFDAENVLTVRLAPPSSAYPEPADLAALWDALEARVATLPSVGAVGTTQSHPLMGSNWGNTIRIAGDEDARDRTVRTTYASPGLFEALGLRVVRGRAISAEDRSDAPPVAVVNETFVARYLGEDVDPLGEAILGSPDGALLIPIVGVVEDVVERAIDEPPEPTWYVPMSQGSARTRSLVVRTAGPPTDALPAIQEAIWSIDGSLPLFSVETMEALIERRVASYGVIADLMAAFALLSLLLGGVGIYGVTAHATTLRTGEIGVRLAMGAQRGDVIRMVLAGGARRTVVGLALGLAAASGLGGLLGSVLVGVTPNDPVVFGTVVVVLGVVSWLGLYLPARRAASTDPVRALASEWG